MTRATPQASAAPVPVRGRMLRHAAPIAAYAMLTAILTWPVVTAPGAWVPHDLGDPLLSTWTLWWNAERLPFTDAWLNGPMFYPAPGALALSDHRVGISLFTTPLIRAAVSPLAAHNLAWLLSYVLSAAAAYALAHTLSGRRIAAFIAGLVYGFHPFRAEHLPHLELLSSYWLPLVLLALHRWLETLHARWLVVLAGSLILVGFTTGYYFFFLGVLIGLWLIWFLPWNLPPGRYIALTAALAAPFVPLAPVLLGYRAVHQHYGLARSITEIEELSADVRGLIAAPDALFFWNVPAAWRTPEGALFPGVTAVSIVLLAFVLVLRDETSSSGRPASRARGWLLWGGLLAVAVALVPAVAGPQRVEVGPLRVSVSDAYKPMSVAALLLLAWALTSPAVRQAWRRRAALPFYALATVAMWVCAFGPTARLAGERVLYKAPYSWLMLLPGFADGFRAPARFGMVAALCLSAAAALAVLRMTSRLTPGARRLVAGLIATGVLADGLVYPMPFKAAPAPLAVPAGIPADAAVLELPIGVFEDAAAMYHGTQHRRPVVNGLSGYEPPHYGALRGAIRDGDTGVVEMIAVERPLAVFLRKGTAATETMSVLPKQSRARHVATTAEHEVFLLSAAPRAASTIPDPARAIPILSVEPSSGADQAQRMRDGDRRTAWMSDGPQRGGEWVTLTLDGERSVTGLVLSQGAFPSGFPRELAIGSSTDGENWQTVWQGPTGALTVAAALDDPREVRLVVQFPVSKARFVRLTQTGRSLDDSWAVAELAVLR